MNWEARKTLDIAIGGESGDGKKCECFSGYDDSSRQKPVEEITWRGVLDTDEVCLVVPRITVRELDKHKDQHPSRKKDRARRRLQRIVEWKKAGAAPLRDWVTAQVYNKPPVCDFEQLHLDRDRADDVLIATTYQYKQENPSRMFCSSRRTRLRVRLLMTWG